MKVQSAAELEARVKNGEKFERAELSGLNLMGAQLSRAQLQRAALDGAIFAWLRGSSSLMATKPTPYFA